MAGEFLTIELNADAAIAAMQKAPARVERAVRRSLNRALTAGRAEMARRVAKDMGMRVGRAKDAIIGRQASISSGLSVRLAASKRILPVSQFDPRQTAAGVTFRGLNGRQLIPGAFLARVRGPLPSGVVSPGHDGVFKRRGKARLPIYQLYAVSIGNVFNRHRPPVVEVMTEAFEKNLAHELKFAETEDV